MDRRATRSRHPLDALQHLVEAVFGRSRVEAVAVVDEDGRVLAGVGAPERLSSLASLAKPVVRGDRTALGTAWSALDGTDVFLREIETAWGPLLLTALGDRVGRMYEASVGIQRICAAANVA